MKRAKSNLTQTGIDDASVYHSLALIRRRLWPDAPLAHWDDRDFDANFSDRKIKNAIGWRASKDINVGPSCFKCYFNLCPDAGAGTWCGLPTHLSRNRCLSPIHIIAPKKAVCDHFTKQR